MDRLFDWHGTDADPTQVVYGSKGGEGIHFEAPGADCLKMKCGLFSRGLQAVMMTS
ncbi:MAG: hypothetical protein OXC72_00840 [Roseovarius sp.]|nr:hypothetical protein [Roseovarius sp.]